MFFFERLVRFETADGQEFYGEAPEHVTGPELIGTEVLIYENPLEDGGSLSTTRKKVAEVLSPIPKAAHIYGVGLNYKAHAAEANVNATLSFQMICCSQFSLLQLPVPDYPMVFSKPVDALAGPYEPIPIDKECTLMDYEVRHSDEVALFLPNRTIRLSSP